MRVIFKVLFSDGALYFEQELPFFPHVEDSIVGLPGIAGSWRCKIPKWMIRDKVAIVERAGIEARNMRERMIAGADATHLRKFGWNKEWRSEE